MGIKKISDSVKMISCGGFDSNMYLVNSELLIDAGTGFHPKIVVQELHELGLFFEDIKRVILTHAHFDHAGGAHLFNSAKLGMHKDDAGIVEKGDNAASMAGMFSAVMKKKPVDFRLDGGDVIKSGNITLKVIHTPGHTKGSICLYDAENRMLFSGDTVFAEGFGRIDFPGGSSLEMKKSLESLSRLDIDMILPGHGSVVWGGGTETVKRLLRQL